jgi:hypothetical protein
MAKGDAMIDLLLECGHSKQVEKRPNPRRKWPLPVQCEACKRKKRVVEIHSKTNAVVNTSMVAHMRHVKKKRRKRASKPKK